MRCVYVVYVCTFCMYGARFVYDVCMYVMCVVVVCMCVCMFVMEVVYVLFVCKNVC